MNDYQLVEVYNQGQWNTVWIKKTHTEKKQEKLEKVKNN